MSHSHEHVVVPVEIEPGTLAWSEWVKDYYRDIESYDWVEVSDGWKGPEAITHRLREAEVRRQFRRYADQSAPALDAGAGTGLNLRHLPIGSAGLDINPRNVELLRRRLPNHMAVLGDVEQMPFPDQSFGTVVCTEVLEHVPSAAQALSEIHRVLRPGGLLIGSVPANSFIWRFRFLSRTCPKGEPFHNQYGPEQVRVLLESAGLAVEYLGYSALRLSVSFRARR